MPEGTDTVDRPGGEQSHGSTRVTADRPMRARELGLAIGRMPTGPRNAITDVAGVLVGHETIARGAAQTGVTAILPHGGSLFDLKVTAAVHVINGFGTSAGLMQVEEMGVIETPIVLTNTFGVGNALNGLLDHMLAGNAEIGRALGTVNPVVCECNDGFLNDIRDRVVTPEHVAAALSRAGPEVAEGAVGAGRGMSCYSFKGGIGTASRQFACGGEQGTLGALVLTNMGMIDDLTIDLTPVGRTLMSRVDCEDAPDMGSIIIVLATNMPLSERQLRRIAKRSTVGLARTGSHIDNGSGDIAIAFTTADPTPHAMDAPVRGKLSVHEDEMNTFFRAAAETVEEAILNSMLMAETVTGRDGNTRHSLSRYLAFLPVQRRGGDAAANPP